MVNVLNLKIVLLWKFKLALEEIVKKFPDLTDLQKEQNVKLSKSVVCNWLEALSVADYKEPQSKEQALLNMA